MQKRFPGKPFCPENSNSRDLRKQFVEDLLVEYALEESTLRACREKYKIAFIAVYVDGKEHMPKSSAFDKALDTITVDNTKGRLRLQRNNELVELGFML